VGPILAIARGMGGGRMKVAPIPVNVKYVVVFCNSSRVKARVILDLRPKYSVIVLGLKHVLF
jgi:hypothetical protein